MDPNDFEEIGHDIRRESPNDLEAEHRCALYLYAYKDSLAPGLTQIDNESDKLERQRESLRSYLYDRPDPVDDTAMLARRKKIRMLGIFAIFACLLSVAGNIVTFDFFGYGIVASFAFATVLTVAPLLAGYKAHELICARSKHLELAAAGVALVLFATGIVQLAQARRMMLEKVDTPAAVSYVQNGTTDDADPGARPDPNGDNSDAKINRMKGNALLWIALGSELMLGLLVGEREHLRTLPDYVSWHELNCVNDGIDALAHERTTLDSNFEAAKKWCMAGILRARTDLNRRKPPYHRALIPLGALFLCAVPSHSYGQRIEREEGIIIDESASIARRGNDSLFREYLAAARKLLLTEPPNSQVWVSVISTDSFGGVTDVVRGFTPDARGVLTDDLNHARKQLASAFDAKTSSLSPKASGTDIFGALWHMKIAFESDRHSSELPKEIWIFSDMMNETKSFPMPELLEGSPEDLLRRAYRAGLIVSLKNYTIHILGASPCNLTPQEWIAVKQFWKIYSSAANATLSSYSIATDAARN